MGNGLGLSNGAAHFDALTLLELVLQLHGDFRRNLEPLRVPPLQAGGDPLPPSSYERQSN